MMPMGLFRHKQFSVNNLISFSIVRQKLKVGGFPAHCTTDGSRRNDRCDLRPVIWMSDLFGLSHISLLAGAVCYSFVRLMAISQEPRSFTVNTLMSAHMFKIGVANQANPKMQNTGGQQNRDHPLSGLHFSARHFSACRGSCSVFLQCVLTSG
jgi:hypothetical protein